MNIEKGIIIKKYNYRDSDEIITILLKSGQLITLISMGSRKITSKNRNALQIGAYIEFEYFKARLVGKISKLKKAILIQQVDILKRDNAQLLFDTMSQLSSIDKGSKDLYNAFIETYPYWGFDFNYHIKTYIISKKLDILGIKPVSDRCIECNGTDRIAYFSFSNGGFHCVKHTKYKMNVEVLKGIKYLFMDFEDYLIVKPEINKEIFDMLKKYLYEYKGFNEKTINSFKSNS